MAQFFSDRLHETGREVVEADGGRGKLVGMFVEILCDDADALDLNASFAQVTRYLFNAEQAG